LVLLVFSFVLGGLFLRFSLEGDELAHQVLVDIHYGRVVVEVAAVVFGTENGNELLVLAKEAVAILHHLMASAYQIKIML